MGLGLTRDPYLMAGLENMWVNVGRGQFHLPTRATPQVVRGTTALVMPDLDALLKRLDYAKKYLEGTKFSFREAGDVVETTCPWGNRIRVHAPDPDSSARCASACRMSNSTCRPAPTSRASPSSIPRSSAASPASRRTSAGSTPGPAPRLTARSSYRETKKKQPEYDGHHIQITLADFSGPHKKLLERGLITEESDQHQYRFLDIVDVDTNKPLFRIEHETRSMRHPMFNRVFVNRNPEMNNRNFVPGHEVGIWAMA